MKGIQIYSNEGPNPFLKDTESKESEKMLMIVKERLLQEPGANLNQTWHKAFLGEGDSSLFK